MKMGGLAAGAGAAKLAFADPGTGSYTPSAMPEAWGGGYLKASPLPLAPCSLAAASLFGRSDNFGIILVSFLGSAGII